MLEQIDRADTASLAFVWKRLAAFLETHAEARSCTSTRRCWRSAGARRAPTRPRTDARRDRRPQRDPRRRGRGGQAPVGSNPWYEAVAAANKATATTWPRRSARASPTSACTPRWNAARAGRRVRRLRGVPRHRREAVDKDPRSMSRSTESVTVGSRTQPRRGARWAPSSVILEEAGSPARAP